MSDKDQFKESMEKLEEIAQRMKSDAINLTDQIAMFEEGMEYYKQCDSILSDTEQKIEVIKKENEDD